MSKIGYKPVTMKDSAVAVHVGSHEATVMMKELSLTGMHREALAPTYYYSHSYFDSQVSWHQFQSDALPHRKGDETQFTTKYPRQDETQVTKYWVFGPLTKISHIQDGFAYNFSSPNHKHQNWYCRRWGRLAPNNRRLGVPPFLSLLAGLVLLINKT
jgi:hypothetical protein